MTVIIIAAAATACVLTAIEGLLISLGKWRGLIAISLSTLFLFLQEVSGVSLFIYSLAATFAGLIASLAVEQAFTGISVREMRGLPRRVDRL